MSGSEKIKAMRGSEERSEEVSKWLKSQGATNADEFSCKHEDMLYFVGAHNKAHCLLDDYAQLVDIVELTEKPAVCLKPFDKVLVRDDGSQQWVCDLFSYYSETTHRYVCGGGVVWSECVPYEGNEHLVGKI